MNKKVLAIGIFVISTTLLIIALFNIFNWQKDNKKVDKILKEIETISTIEEVVEDNNENIEIIDPPKETIPKENPYWDYIKMNLINVDLKALKKKNNDTKGWIQVNGTKVNYPFVQASDNEYYLKHSFDKSYNVAGWVFLDYRNNLENNDKNTILYAHSMESDIMFGTLKYTLKKDWLNNPNNYVIKLSTEQENTLWQIFSIYVIPTTNDYMQIKFNSDEQYLKFVNKMLNRSEYNFNATVSENDRILTLSTCSGKDDKLVIHAKLIKRENK